MLKNLLVCARCGRSMAAGYTTTKGRRYAYYISLTAQKRGARACGGRMIGKQRIEAAVIDTLDGLASPPGGAGCVSSCRRSGKIGTDWSRGSNRRS